MKRFIEYAAFVVGVICCQFPFWFVSLGAQGICVRWPFFPFLIGGFAGLWISMDMSGKRRSNVGVTSVKCRDGNR